MDGKMCTRKNFGVLRNNEVSYFDYAATTFMPDQVINAWNNYQSNVGILFGKGNNVLAIRAYDQFCNAEATIKNHFNIGNNYEFIYGKNTTELINMLALSYPDTLHSLDCILAGPYEHHSNLLPWKYLAKRNNAVFLEMPLTKEGQINYKYLQEIKDIVSCVVLSSVANSNGFMPDLQKICEIFNNSYIFIDESQNVAHAPIYTNDRITGYILSSHKMYGPKNIAGALVKKSYLEKVTPVLLGGGMVDTVSFEDTWGETKKKFEAGTFDIGLLVAWSEACTFIDQIGYDNIQLAEESWYEEIKQSLIENKRLRILNIEGDSKSILTFVSDQHHAHDLEYILSEQNIIIRSGNLCAQPSIRKMNEYAVNRISFGLGIEKYDIEKLASAIRRL